MLSGCFFLILYTTSVFVASVCRGSFSSMIVLLVDLTLNLQPNDQEKCFSVLFCKPISCCDYILDNLSQKKHFLLPRTPLETPTFYFTLQIDVSFMVDGKIPRCQILIFSVRSPGRGGRVGESGWLPE